VIPSSEDGRKADQLPCVRDASGRPVALIRTGGATTLTVRNNRSTSSKRLRPMPSFPNELRRNTDRNRALTACCSAGSSDLAPRRRGFWPGRVPSSFLPPRSAGADRLSRPFGALGMPGGLSPASTWCRAIGLGLEVVAQRGASLSRCGRVRGEGHEERRARPRISFRSTRRRMSQLWPAGRITRSRASGRSWRR
jgi:hypothetical protein